jgi:tRNA-2-methylthio-N6-dimethylallyladenosine synthase
VSAFVTIMEGCDKKCAYCIVPFTRGQEVSRPVDEVVAEVRALAESGYKEVMLLGQNVNSYGKRFPDGNGYKGPGGRRQMLESGDGQLADFPVLLRRIDAETGIQRLRFTTSHPFDAHERLFAAMAECGSVCEHLHLPVQSGSNRVLKAMRRGYTVEEYEAKVARLRVLAPETLLSTDIIVGFPGETEEDFEATCALMERVGYDSAFIFKYSMRPGTEAAEWVDAVPPEEKDRRNQVLLVLQEQTSRAKLERWVGRTVEVLIERRNARGQLAGRTRGNVSVVCREGNESLIGGLVPVRVERMTATTLIGSVA